MEKALVCCSASGSEAIDVESTCKTNYRLAEFKHRKWHWFPQPKCCGLSGYLEAGAFGPLALPDLTHGQLSVQAHYNIDLRSSICP